MNHEKAIGNVIDYIEENIKSDLTVEKLSEVACISQFHFHRIFKQVTNETLISYIKHRRLTKACLDLLDTDKSILTIALECKFTSNEAFHRSFKKVYGITPYQYRKKREMFYQNHKTKINLDQYNNYIPEPNIVTYPETLLIGYMIYASCTNNTYQTDDPDGIRRNHFWSALAKLNYPVKNATLYTYGKSLEYEEFDDGKYQHKYKQFIGVLYNDTLPVPDGLLMYKKAKCDVIEFYHKGESEKFNRTLINIYDNWLPKYNLDIDPLHRINIYNIGLDGELLNDDNMLDYEKLHNYNKTTSTSQNYMNSPDFEIKHSVFLK